MDLTTAITSLYVQGRQQQVQNTAEMKMMEKSLEVQKQQGQNALELINAVTPSSSLPDNLGQNLNVVA